MGVARQVLRVTGPAVAIDVGGRGDRQNARVEKPARDQRRWRRLPETDRQIETVADEIRDPVPGFKAQLQPRVAQQELAQLRRQDHAGEQRIHIDPQPAADRLAGFRRRRRRLADPRQVLGDPLMQRAPLVGELDGAAGAVDQPGAEAGFELGDRLADAGLRHAQPLGGPAEAARVGNRGEHDQATDQPTVNLVHRSCLSVIQEMTPGW